MSMVNWLEAGPSSWHATPTLYRPAGQSYSTVYMSKFSLQQRARGEHASRNFLYFRTQNGITKYHLKKRVPCRSWNEYNITQWILLTSRFTRKYSAATLLSLKNRQKRPRVFLFIYFWLNLVLPLCPETVVLYTVMILRRIRITVKDAGFKPGSATPQLSGVIPMSHHIFLSLIGYYMQTALPWE